MRLMSIASGSSGNCIYAGNGDTHLLVDAGISGKRIENGLKEIGLSVADMDGILLTHEHTDHVQGLGVLARRYHKPIFATRGTIEAIVRTPALQPISPDLFHEVRADEILPLKDMEVLPMRISHDAAEPVAYRFYERTAGPEGGRREILKDQKKSMAVCTDLGFYDDYIKDHLRGLSALLLESNHDIHMLEAGRYPYPLKQRILSEKGHLSNDAAGQLLMEIMCDSLNAVFLGHLSHENNYPELAYETVRLELTLSGRVPPDRRLLLKVARREERSEMIEV